MGNLVVASHNRGKSNDIASFFVDTPLKLSFAYELGLSDVDETGSSFEENATLKARAASRSTQTTAIGDDSGLCIPDWGNKPGLETKRFAMIHGGWEAGIKALKPFAMKNQRARYYCALAVAWSENDFISVLGHVDGYLSWPPKGQNGSGFDPIFSLLPNGKRFAEFSSLERESINHRGHAFELLYECVTISASGQLKRSIPALQPNLG